MIPRLGEEVTVKITGRVKAVEEWPDNTIRVKIEAKGLFATIDEKWVFPKEDKDGKAINS